MESYIVYKSPGRHLKMGSIGDEQLRYPPLDGSLPAFWGALDWHAEYNPSTPWVIFPTPHGPEATKTLSFLEFAQASHRVAHVLRPGRAGPEGQVVALLLHCDSIHYNAMLAGTMRAGIVPFPMSPRNTPEAVVNMLEKTNCHRIISQDSLSPLAKSVQTLLSAKNYVLQVQELPPLDDVFPNIRAANVKPTPVTLTPYPRPATPHTPDDLVCIHHSSGSTGFPKPIPLTQKVMNQWMGCSFIKSHRAHKIRHALMGLPTFHAMGFNMQFMLTLANGQAWAAYEPQYPAPPVIPTPQNTVEVAKITGCNGMMVVPTFVEAFAASDEYMAYLKTLRILLFGGGPLSATAGAKLEAAGVNAAACYGLTESGPFISVWDEEDPTKLRGDWKWIGFPQDAKCRWVPQGDGSFELHFLTCKTHQPAVENLADTKGYATSDLLIPHPTKPGLWHVIGRVDDVIILGSGEKIVPLAQESFLSTRPMLQGAVMFGRGRHEPGVLLEPTPEHAFDPADLVRLAQFRNQVWPYVEEANKLAPAFARIFKEMIIVTDPGKPMGRAGKGTVQRKHTLKNYEKEINQLYDSVQASKDDNGIAAPSHWTLEETTVWLIKHITLINNSVPASLFRDLFAQGFDSLSATFLRNRILGALRSSPDPAINALCTAVPQELVFVNPTIDRLAQAITRLIHPFDSDEANNDAEEINAMIAKYSADIPAASSSRLSLPNDGTGLVVLLTGSTGGLGSHLLATLLGSSRIAKVYTFDRGLDVKTRQKASFEDRGIPLDHLESTKLHTLSVDYDKPDFGLSNEVLNDLKQSVTHIIHNAWKVDFNLALSSFESNVRSTRSLLDFSASCAHAAHITLCSSIASASRWDVRKGRVPEEVLEDLDVVGGNGYAKSKHVAERIMAEASKKGYTTTSLRIGQIAGSTASGAWNTSDWVPIIVKSSLALGCLPDLPGNASWFSADTICETMLDIVTTDQVSRIPEVMNIVHPRPRAWHDIMIDIKDTVGPMKQLPLIPFADWVTKVEAASVHASEKDLERIPAIKLMLFLRQVASSTATRDSDLMDAEGTPQKYSFDMGTRGYIMYRYKKRFVARYNHWDSYPDGLGLDLLEEIPCYPVGFEKWLESMKEFCQNLFDAHDSKSKGNREISAEEWEVNDAATPNDIMIEWTYEMDLDNLVFHIDGEPMFRLDCMPTAEGFVEYIGLGLH
ncbi:putative NRPS-like protein biosynthetic cluster [Steccherinum ochraceum]|uniref:Putative NRPS-like protein biosynthetic cluster n=1 Tax=Steccherinum ochraceum TaxID=92696 RepID=A0A4R0RUB8_9APHY|nr:putative NRPS-like protein biosynthetic cluster [Steccherinum ochraceum]